MLFSPKTDSTCHQFKYRYNICMDVYNGELKRHLSQSQYGHIGESILTDKLLKYNESDATTIRHNGKCNK